MKYENGQSLIELLVAMAIFVIVIGSISFLILDSYAVIRLTEETTKANFLAEEGIEAVRSIRDNFWDALSEGPHGLAIFGNNWWVFQDSSEKIDKFTRVITIDEIDINRKKITSEISWQFKNRLQEVRLVTYLTNWENPFLPHLSQLHYRWRNDDGGE